LIKIIESIFKHIFALIEVFFSLTGRANRFMFNTSLVSLLLVNHNYYNLYVETNIAEDFSPVLVFLTLVSVISLIIRRLKDYKVIPEYTNEIERSVVLNFEIGRWFAVFELFFVMSVDDKDDPFKYKNYPEMKFMALMFLAVNICLFLYLF
ncbi:MAG TPA: hypothetical protein DCL21_06410, partial [Alphaproteobacteria bacterium]|nr:hypothetical protein [Alphaproteobacteria bacterium]